MANLNVFEYLSYRVYLKERLETLGSRSGLKRRASESLGVHTTFISQVVLGKADISLDQAERFNSFLEHSEPESEFFLDLVIYERASDPKLKKRFEAKLKKKQSERLHIKKRLEKSKELADEDQERFYSSHLYGILHVLASIPKYQSREQLIRGSGCPADLAKSAIDFMIRIGVLKNKGELVVPGEQHVHLSRDSKFIRQHHTNWRTAAVQHLGFSTSTDIHYSLAFSCSEADAAKIRESLLAHLQSLTNTVEASKEQQAFVYSFDFYRWI